MRVSEDHYPEGPPKVVIFIGNNYFPEWPVAVRRGAAGNGRRHRSGFLFVGRRGS
jgi:hypothetical protein